MQTTRLSTQWRRTRLCTLLILVLVGGSMGGGCGYTVLGSADSLHSPGPLLAVAPLTNQTREPDFERLITGALHHALLQNQLLRATTEDETAEHRLQGTIRRFRALALSFDETDNVLQYRLEADVYVRLVDGPKKSVIFEQEISAAAEYLVSRDVTSNVREDVVARQAALVRLAQQFADKCLALLAIILL
ncbi:MAG: LPS assembly lipoprotein LptE [Candidatus Tectimicrobiota bacterium]